MLRRRFSATNFLPDVRRYGVTFFNYVGKPLSYILATPERADDADNPLRIAFGNEAAPLDVDRFARAVRLHRRRRLRVDRGRPEHGPHARHAEGFARAAGRADPRRRSSIPTPATECPPAEFDAAGRLLNAEAAIGEIVNPDGGGGFEGYYNNPEADAERVRDGVYWTGDLGYRDEHGFFYFAGRSGDWLRVDGENFAATPVELVLARHPDVVLAAVYAVPSVDVGDEVMAALHLRAGADVRPRRVRRVPRRAARRLAEVDAALRARHRRAAVDRDAEGAEAGAAPRALGVRRPGVVATRPRPELPSPERRCTSETMRLGLDERVPRPPYRSVSGNR